MKHDSAQILNSGSADDNLTADAFITRGGNSSQFVKGDGSLQTASFGTMSQFYVIDGDSTQVTMNNNKYIKFKEGSGIDVNFTDTSSGSSIDPFDLTFTNTDRGSSQAIFKNIAVSGQSTITADSNNDTLTFVGGTDITITTNATTDTLTINSTGSYDNYNGWELYTDDISRGTITSAEQVRFNAGTGITLGYNATNNVITINSSGGVTPTLQQVVDTGSTSTTTITMNSGADIELWSGIGTGAKIDINTTLFNMFDSAGTTFTQRTNQKFSCALPNGDQSTLTATYLQFQDGGVNTYDIKPPATIAADRIATFPDKSGTVAFLDDISVGGATQLNELSDVNTSTPTNKNVLIADGVDWESRALTEADISDLGDYVTLSTPQEITGIKTFVRNSAIAGYQVEIHQTNSSGESSLHFDHPNGDWVIGNASSGDFKIGNNTSFASLVAMTITDGTQDVTIHQDLTVTGNISAANAITNETDTYSSHPDAQKIITLTAAEYAAIGTKNANTLYFVV